MEERLAQLLTRDTERRLLEESLPRIRKCLAQLSEEEIWYRPNSHTVSIGNLILHLNGNVKQWVLSTLGGQKDLRQRQLEFDEKGPLPTSGILADLESTLEQVRVILHQLTTDDLTREYYVQGFSETGVSILMHVTEHFSYHVGQITYSTKSIKDMDMGYYDGQDLDTTS